MSYYVYLYIISIFLSLLGGWMVYRGKKDLSGFFFLLFTVFSSIWFIIYFLFFSDTFHGDELLMLSRIGFLSGIPTVYSFLGFIYFYERKNVRFSPRSLALLVFIGIALTWIYTNTTGIIAGLEYDQEDMVYREVTGKYFALHFGLHLGFLIGLFYAAYRALQRCRNLDRIRLKFILLSGSALIISLLILQLILPYFGIWILEREIIFLFSIFVISVPIIIRRYYFSHIGYQLGDILTVVLSFLLAFISVDLIKKVFLYVSNTNLGYWNMLDEYPILEVSTIFVTYLFFSYGAKKLLHKYDTYRQLQLKMQKLKSHISQTMNIEELNSLIEKEFSRVFGARNASLLFFDSSLSTSFQSTFTRFFHHPGGESVFINDIVFIDAKKSKIGKDLEIPKDIFLIFPIFSKEERLIGVLMVGKKNFNDFYSTYEIQIVIEFISFLQIHLRYLDTYDIMQDLSMNLDKKVDEKTMEYNQLVSRQKEFISLVSHEVRSPLSSLLFQADSLISDLSGTARIAKKRLLDELKLLRSQLVRTSSLVAKIFAVEYHDARQISLFREKIQLPQFLSHELDLFRAVHKDVRLIQNIDEKVGFQSIDKIQFQQVIANLLDNALKFADAESPIIVCTLKKKGKNIIFIVEDNGDGLGDIDPNTLFDKYTTGKNKNVGLGMGLYLCKKIVSLHGGTINGSISRDYGGAAFTIIL